MLEKPIFPANPWIQTPSSFLNKPPKSETPGLPRLLPSTFKIMPLPPLSFQYFITRMSGTGCCLRKHLAKRLAYLYVLVLIEKGETTSFFIHKLFLVRHNHQAEININLEWSSIPRRSQT